MFLQPKRKLSRNLNPEKPLGKDKGYVSVIKHFNPYLSKNSSKNSKLPFPEVITDSNETTESKGKDYVVSNKKKIIKYSRINNSATTKSKLNVLSSPKITKPKDVVFSSNAVKSISLVYNYQKNANQPTQSTKRRNTTLSKTKKKIPDIAAFKKEVNIKQTSVSPVTKLELEQRRFNNAEKLKTKSQNLPKTKPIHENNELDKTSVVLSSIPVVEMSPRNNNLKRLLPLNLSPRGVSTRADLLKDEINTERIKKLVYQNEKMKNLNIVSKRRIIAELKTEIAEFRNKGLYVFNLNIKNNFKSPRSKSLKSKSDGCGYSSPRRSKDDSSIDYSRNSSDNVLTAVSVYKRDSLKRSETNKTEFSSDFNYLTDPHTNLDICTGSPRGNKDNLAGLQKNYICLQAAVRSHKKSQRLPIKNELDSKIEQNKQLVDKVQRILDEIKVGTPKPTTKTDEIISKKVTETPSSVVYRETSTPSLEGSDQELNEEDEKRLEEAEKSHNRPITRRIVHKTDTIKKDKYKTERSGSETDDSINLNRLQAKLNSINDQGSSFTTIEGYLSLRSEQESRKGISKGDQSSSSSADSSDESKKDYPLSAPKRRLRVKNKASLHDSGKSDSSMTLKSLHVVPSKPTPKCTKKHSSQTILKTAGNPEKTVVKTFKHCECNTSLVTGKDFTCNTKKEEVYLDSGCNTESKEFKDLSVGTGLYEKCKESATNTLPPNQTKDIALNIMICNENKDNTCNTDVTNQEDFGCVAKICFNNDFTCNTPILELQDSTCNTHCLVKKDEICSTEKRTTSEVSCFTDIKKEVITKGTQRDKLEGLNMTVKCIKTTDISPKSNLEKTKTLTSQLLPSINIKSTPTFQKILQFYIDQNGITHIEYQYVDEKIGFCEARCNKDNQSVEDKQKIKSSKQENVQQHIEISKQLSTNIEGSKQVIESYISNYNNIVDPIQKNVTDERLTQENIKRFQEQESKFKKSLQNQDININVESPKQVIQSYIPNCNTIVEPIQKNVTDESPPQESIKYFEEQESKFKKNLQNQDTNTNVENPKQLIDNYISNYNTIAEPIQKNVTDKSPTQENIKGFQDQESKSKKSLQNQDTNTNIETLKQPIESCHIPNLALLQKNFTDDNSTQENIKDFQEQETKLKKRIQNEDTNNNVTTKNKKIGTESSQQHYTSTEKPHRGIISICNKEIQVPSLVKPIPSTKAQSKPTTIDKSVSAICPGKALCCNCYKAENLQTKSNPSNIQSISEERLHQFDNFIEFEPKLFGDELYTSTMNTNQNSLDDINSYVSRNNEGGRSPSESSDISYNTLKRGIRKAFNDTDLIETDSYRKLILQSYSVFDDDQNKHCPGELSISCLQLVEQKIDDAVYRTFINPDGKSIAPSNGSMVDITHRTPNSDKSRSDRSKRRASKYSDSGRYRKYLIEKKHGHIDLAPKVFNLGLYENKETQYDQKTMYSSETPMSDSTRILKPTLDEKTMSYRTDKPLRTGEAVTPTIEKKTISDHKESSDSKPTKYRKQSKISYEDISLSISYSTDESDEETSKPREKLSSSLPKNKLHKISTASGTTFRQLKEKISLHYPELSIDSTDRFAKLADGDSKEFDLSNTDGSTYVTGILQQNENDLKKFIPIIKRSVHSSSKTKTDLKEFNADRNRKSFQNSEEKNKMKINMTVLPIHIQGDSVLVDKQRIVDDLYVGKNGRYRDEKNLFSQENFMQLNKKVLDLSTSTGTTEMSFSDGEIRCHCSVSNGEIHMCPNREPFRKFRKPHSFQKDIGLTAVRKRRHYLNNMITYYFNKHSNAHDSSSTS